MQEWKYVLEEECMESKWKALAAQCAAKKNYSLAKGTPYADVSLDMLQKSGGVEYWEGVNVVVTGKIAACKAGAKRSSDSVDGAQPGKVAATGKAKAKPKACPKNAATNKVLADNEKKVKTILSSWQLQVNSLNRIASLVEKNTAEWKWAENDIEEFQKSENKLYGFINEKKLDVFVADMKAAIFSAQSMKAFKNRYKESYPSQLMLFAENAQPMVRDLEDKLRCIEATAFARNCTDFTPEKAQRSTGKSAKAASSGSKPAV